MASKQMDSESSGVKSRKANWNDQERAYLIEMLKQKGDLLTGKLSPVLTHQKKQAELESIAGYLSSNFGHQRTSTEVREKIKQMNCKARREFTDQKASYNQTGGGPRLRSTSPLTKELIDLNANSASYVGVPGGIDNGYIDDADISEKPDNEVVMSDAQAIADEVTISTGSSSQYVSSKTVKTKKFGNNAAAKSANELHLQVLQKEDRLLDKKLAHFDEKAALELKLLKAQTEYYELAAMKLRGDSDVAEMSTGHPLSLGKQHRPFVFPAAQQPATFATENSDPFSTYLQL